MQKKITAKICLVIFLADNLIIVKGKTLFAIKDGY